MAKTERTRNALYDFVGIFEIVSKILILSGDV